MNWKSIEKFENEDLYLECKKTYLMSMAKIVEEIESGSAQAAEQYEHLENTWKIIEQWRAKT